MRSVSYMHIMLLVLTAVLFSSCSFEDWLSSSKNRNMLIFTVSIPFLIGMFSAVLYYYILNGLSSPLGRGTTVMPTKNGWYMWYFITTILSVALIVFLAPGMSKVNVDKWLDKYAALFGLGIIFSMFSFRLFSAKFWSWRRSSKVKHIPNA